MLPPVVRSGGLSLDQVEARARVAVPQVVKLILEHLK